MSKFPEFNLSMLTSRYENIFSARKRRVWCQWDIKWAWINQSKEFIWFENGFGKFFRNRKNVQKCPAKSLENDSTKIRARQFSLQLLTSTPVTLSSINLHVNIGIRRPSKCILCYHPNSILSFVTSISMSKLKARIMLHDSPVGGKWPKRCTCFASSYRLYWF